LIGLAPLHGLGFMIDVDEGINIRGFGISGLAIGVFFDAYLFGLIMMGIIFDCAHAEIFLLMIFLTWIFLV